MPVATIFRGGPSTYITCELSGNTVLTQRLMGENFIKLDEEYDRIKDIAILDFTVFDGATYYVNNVPNIQKISPSQFKHEVIFEGTIYELHKVQYLNNSSDKESDFFLTGDLDDFIDLIITNANRDYSGWTKGTITASFKADYENMSFQGESCLQILQRLMDLYECEYTISGRTINIADKISNATGNTYTYGRENGLKSIKRLTETSQGIITRVYAYGSTRNISNQYRSGKPRLEFDLAGDNFVEKNTTTYGVVEFTKIFDNIYPHFTGSIGTLTSITNFRDTLINFNMNNYLLPGIAPKIHFQDGDLAGYEFEVSAFNDTLNSVSMISFTDQYTGTFPNTTLNAATGDHYTILDITMPTSYVSSAETDLLVAATSFLDDVSEPVVSYGLEMDWKFLRDNSRTFTLGDQITISDTDLNILDNTRVIALTRQLSNTNKYTLEVAQNIVNGFSKQLYNNSRDFKSKSAVDNLGDIPKMRWNWPVTDGPSTGRTWQTDSGLPGHDTYIKIDGPNNKMDFYKDGISVLTIDDNISGSDPGMEVKTGGLIRVFKTGNCYSLMRDEYIRVISDAYVYSINGQNTYVSNGDSQGLFGSFYTPIASTYGKLRQGVKGSSIISNVSNNDNAIGVFGEATTTGTGEAYASYFDDGRNYMKGAATVGGVLHLQDDTLFTKAGSGFAFAEIYGDNYATATTLAAQDTYYQINSFTADGSSNQITPDYTNAHITTDKAGYYLVTCSLDAHSQQSNLYYFTIFKNNGAVELDNLEARRQTSTAGKPGSISLSGIVAASANDTIELWVQRTDGGGSSKSITIAHVNMTLVQIGL